MDGRMDEWMVEWINGQTISLYDATQGEGDKERRNPI